MVRPVSAGAEGPNSHFGVFGPEFVPVYVLMHTGHFYIVQPRPFDAGIIKLKSKRAYEMQAGTGIGAQTNDIARIGRDLRLVKNDMQHKENLEK